MPFMVILEREAGSLDIVRKSENCTSSDPSLPVVTQGGSTWASFTVSLSHCWGVEAGGWPETFQMKPVGLRSTQ